MPGVLTWDPTPAGGGQSTFRGTSNATTDGAREISAAQSAPPIVANLQAAAAAIRGSRGYVTDASAAYTSANLGSTVAGGGANVVPVFCTGSAWVIG